LRAKITALGCYAPPRILTNLELEKLVDTSNEWILERTGIRERHIADPDIATSDMGTEAARKALAQAGLDPKSLEAIVLCTVTPDMFFPSTACLIQHQLGAPHAWGFDLIAACSSFVYGLNTVAQFVQSGLHRRVMVIGADTMSRIIDYTDRNTCVLFGDGAGAMIVEPAAEGEDVGLIDFIGEIDGAGGEYLKMPAGGSRMPPSHETIDKRLHYVHQDGQQVFKYAVRKMYELCAELLKRNHLKADDIGVLIPHQANKRIISATADRLGLPPERVLINIDRYGNTTSATIPLATQDAIAQGVLKKGDLVLFVAVGAGYTAGASLWRWAY
jgi:3-oxoacyl-[acyl-carrier-protein] synthase-3